nr:DUF4251 domain-containing protein [Dysgonomonas sp. ZJ279]
MDGMKLILKITAIILLTNLLASCKTGETSVSDQGTISRMTEKIDSVNYTFVPSTATPMSGGRTIQLTSPYSLKITKDTITSYLPYFGRAYSAPYSSDEGGIKFVSTKFDYLISEKKKGMWDVSIDIKDNQHNYKLVLRIGDTGYTSLTVQENSRQPISFYGKIE